MAEVPPVAAPNRLRLDPMSVTGNAGNSGKAPSDPHHVGTLKTAKRVIGALLGLHVALAALMIGQYPALFRLGGYLLGSSLAGGPRQPGMGVAVYRTVDPSGAGWRHVVPGASAYLDRPNGSLHAFAVWSPPKAGAYVLVFRADEHGAVFVDGHRVTGARARVLNDVGRAAVPLEPGPHLLVVFLRNGSAPGSFSLEVQAPGDASSGPLPSEQLRALNRRYVPYLWRTVERAGAWVRGPFFWIALVLFSGAAAATWPARTGTEAALNGAMILTGVLIGVILGEIGSRLVLPAPTRVTLKTTGNATTAGPRRDVFMIPTDRGFRHAPNSEVVVVHPRRPTRRHSTKPTPSATGTRSSARSAASGSSFWETPSRSDSRSTRRTRSPGWWRTWPGGTASAGRPSTPA